MPELYIEGNDLRFSPPHKVAGIKETLGGRWDKKREEWVLPPTTFTVQTLVKFYGDGILAHAQDNVLPLYDEEWGFRKWDKSNRDLAKSYKAYNSLFQWQKEAVEYAVENPHHGMLMALSPGLGKTPTASVAMDLIGARKILILAPLTLCPNWAAEIEKWAEIPRHIKRATAQDKDPGPQVTITNFETVQEVIHRDEDGNVVEALHSYWLMEDGTPKWEACAPDFLGPDDSGVKAGPKHFKEWRDQGPKKVNPKTGKMVNARERITQARRTYAEIDWDLIVVDESILFKNRNAVKVEVVQQLAKYAHNVWMLSGSPTAKFRDDLYPQLKIISKRCFASYWRFAEQFCFIEKGQWGWSITGDRPDVDLHSSLRDFMFVRDQKDVLPDLPDYILRPLTLELTEKQQKAHNQMLEEFVAVLEDAIEEEVEAPNRLAQLTRLQQIVSNLCNLKKADEVTPWPSSSAKEDALMDLLGNDEIEFPLLIWVNYVPTGEHLEERLAKEHPELTTFFARGAGTEKQKAFRQAKLDAFKAGALDVLIMQYEVGKFGHTFTGTKSVFYADYSMNSDSHIQSLRRVKRIGLTHSPQLIMPTCPGTVDELILANLEGKMRSIAEVSQADLVELLRSLGR